MGLFDSVRCQMPLPVKWRENPNFQTKELGCTMITYTISPAGRLLVPERDYGTYRIPESSLPIDGSFAFYDVDREWGWLTLRAIFVSGLCRRIEVEDWRPHPLNPDVKPPKEIRNG